MPTSYTSTSDAAGHFVFEEVEPGRYTLSAERSGYVRGNYGARSNASVATPLALSAGQKMTGISFKLTPQGIISGRITDEDGDPVTRSQVMVYQSRYQNGRRTLSMAGNSSNTLADGTFQIAGLAAGRYYLSAQDLQMMIVNGPNEQPGRKGPEDSYVTTYYPNATDLSSAAPIDVTAGTEVRGIEIRLQRARVFRVHGRVTGVSPVSNMSLQLVPMDSGDPMTALFSGRSMSAARPDGTFDFQHVLPGTYVIRSQMIRTSNTDTGPATPLYAHQVVTVSNANIDNLEVPLVPGGEITGSITIEGREQQQQQSNDSAKSAASGAQTTTSRPTVALFPLQPAPGANAANAQSNDDGTFRIKNIGPEQYRVNVNGLPAGTYVKSILYGGRDVTKSSLDGTSGLSGTLNILLSPDAADLSGVARNSKGEVVAGLTLSLWEPAAANVLPEALVFRMGVTDQNGNFQFRGLPPAEYRVAAWEASGPNIQDPQFRGKFESQTVTVKLAASAHGNADVTAISQEAFDVESAKLQ